MTFQFVGITEKKPERIFICHSNGNQDMKKLFLDDIRTPEMVYDKTVATDFVVVRSYAAVK